MTTYEERNAARWAAAQARVMLDMAVYSVLPSMKRRARVVGLKRCDVITQASHRYKNRTELWEVTAHNARGVYARRIYKTREPGKPIKYFTYHSSHALTERALLIPGLIR